MTKIKIFDKHRTLGTDGNVYTWFSVTQEYASIATKLSLFEWSPIIWIGRLICLDNDYGEHIFDNWNERDALLMACPNIKLHETEIFIVSPDRLKNGKDGPCNTDDVRKLFWENVFESLSLDLELLFIKAEEYAADEGDNISDIINDLRLLYK